jgi:hypothetical protein
MYSIIYLFYRLILHQLYIILVLCISCQFVIFRRNLLFVFHVYMHFEFLYSLNLPKLYFKIILKTPKQNKVDMVYFAFVIYFLLNVYSICILTLLLIFFFRLKSSFFSKSA